MRVLRGMSKPELQRAAASKGIDVIGLSRDQLRSKLEDGTPSQLRRFKSGGLPVEHPTGMIGVSRWMKKSELQRAAAAKGIDVIGLTSHELRRKLEDCTLSQLRGLRSQCPPAEPPKTMRATRLMTKRALQRVAVVQGINVTGLSRDELRLKLAGWTPRPLKVSSSTSCPSAGFPSEASVVLTIVDDDEVMISYDSPSSSCLVSESDWSEAAEPEAKDVSRHC
jgi:hypothetical protein